MKRGRQIQVELDGGERREIPAADAGGTLADMLAAGGLPLNIRCGQRGLCRGCEIQLQTGTVMVEGNPVAAPATVKACRAQLESDVTLYLPVRSRLEHRPQVGDTFEIAVPYAHQPLFAWARGARDTGFAVDIGTTTVVVLLVDLVTGAVLARAGAFNEQIRFGDNVITRIEAARQPGKRQAMQQAVVAETIRPLLE
ncbi:MAG TPA: 2Fe-2S iron-sulfur cluster-binding protein, partial [Verrucomicrobiae bacterium]